MSKEEVYSGFFNNRSNSWKSAKAITPLVYDLIQPESVVDVGCGSGEFLHFFKENGAEEVLGVDGSWVDQSKLKIEKDEFITADLENPLYLDENFDLVISLEVAEHLSQEAAETFVNSLTSLGPVILFSAAIPFQGGVNHLNEQWPTYWADYFSQENYVVLDPFRKKIWKDQNVSFWYAQNILLFVDREYLKEDSKLNKEYKETERSFLDIAHPENYLANSSKSLYDFSIRDIAPHLLKRIIKKIFIY